MVEKKSIEKTEHKAFSSLSKAVRNRRNELKLTQKELANYAGCGVVFIYDLELGKPSIRLDKLVEVLIILGLELRLQLGKAGLEIAPELEK